MALLALAGGVGTGRPSGVPVARADGPTNGKIAFVSSRTGDHEIFLMEPDGTGQFRLSDNPATDEMPAWSRDGTKIAFVSNRDGNDDIYVMNADGTGQSRLTTTLAPESVPTWSPDGAQIAFVSLRDGNPEIYVMDANGSNQARLTTDPSFDVSPAWSPSLSGGSKIAFASFRFDSALPGLNFDIFLMNPDGTGVTRLTTDPSFDVSPAWSPDGAKIAFSAWRHGNSEIYVMDADGTDQVRLTDDPAADELPAWSPDGTKIAHVSNRHGNSAIYRMNADGTDVVQLTDRATLDSAPSWQPVWIPTTCPAGQIGTPPQCVDETTSTPQPEATPELDSLTLLGGGLSVVIAGYAWLRRGRREVRSS